MKQYLQIKEQNQDAILFFRLGDFYEMFGDDARKASKELDLTLTTRDKDKNKSFEEKIPMCGIPYHASDAYIARLIAKGYKVAICEQTEDPATAKGLVDRDIIRVVTPGTVIDAACLEEGRSNFCAGLYLDDTCAGFSVCDISTGKTHVTAFQGPDRAEHLLNELGRFSPAEAVVNQAAYDCGPLLSLMQDKLHCHVERLSAGRFQLQEAERTVRQQFGDEAAARLPKGNPAAALSLGALLGYLHETQKTDLRHVDDLDYYQQGQFMELDLTARRNLELTETLRSKEKKGSLLWVLDKTKTPMGGRMLRSWLERPLLSVTAITRRSGAVGQLVDHTMTREELALALSNGTAEAQDNATYHLVANATYDDIKYFSNINYMWMGCTMAANKIAWDKLNETTQNVLREKAKEAAQFSFDCIAEDNVTARKTMEEGGVQFCDNPDIDSFKKKLDIPAYYTRYASEAWYDQSLVDTIYNYGNK